MNFFGDAEKMKAEQEAELKAKQEEMERQAQEAKEKAEAEAKKLAMKVMLYKFFYCCMDDPTKDLPKPPVDVPGGMPGM